MINEFEARVNKIVLPTAQRFTHPPERLVPRPLPYPRFEPLAPAWLFSALAWTGRAFYDGGMVERRFATWVAGSDVDPYTHLGATRLFLIVRVGEQFRLTIAPTADADAPATGGTLYPISDAGITALYEALSSSPVFDAVRYCYVPGLAAQPAEAEPAAVYLQVGTSGYDPATGLRTIVGGSAVAQAVPLTEFESVENEQVYDPAPHIVPIASSLVYDLSSYNELGATTFALPTMYARERLEDGAEVVNNLGAQAVVFSGGPGYDATTAQALEVLNTATTVMNDQAFTRTTYAASVAVSIVPLADSADISVTALTCTSSTPWTAFSQQGILGFYRAAAWQQTSGVPIYDYGQANASFAAVAAPAEAKGPVLTAPTLVFDPQHSALNGGTLDAVGTNLVRASYLVSSDRLAAILHAAINAQRVGEFGLRVMTAALSFADAAPKLQDAAEAARVPQQRIMDSSLFVYTDLDLTNGDGTDASDTEGVYVASAVLNSSPDDRSAQAFAPARLLMGLVRPVRMGSVMQYAFVPEDDSVLIDGVRYLLSVIPLDDLTVDPNSRPYRPVFWPRTRYWQFANRHNPYRDVEYVGDTQADRVKRAQTDTARIGRATARAGEPMHMYLDTRENAAMRVWPIYGFPYTHATRTVDRTRITAISDAVLALLGQHFAPAPATVVDGLDAERVTVPGVLTLDNPYTTTAATSPDETAAAADGVRITTVEPTVAGRAVRNLASDVIAAPLPTTIDEHLSVRSLSEQQTAAAISTAKSVAVAFPVEQQREVAADATPLAIAAARRYQSVYGFSVVNKRTGEAYLVEVVEADLTPPDRLPRSTTNQDYDPYYVRVVFLDTLTSYNMTMIVPTVAYDQHRHLGRQGVTYQNVISHTDELGLGYLASLYDTSSNFDELTFQNFPPDAESAKLAYSQTVLFSNVPYSLPQDTSVSPLDLFTDVVGGKMAPVERDIAQEAFGDLINYHRLAEPPAYFLCRRLNWSADCHLMQATHTDGSAAYLAFGGGDIVPLRLDADFTVDKRQPAHLYKLTTTFADRQYDAATTISVSNTPYIISVSTATGSAQFASLSINPTAGTADIAPSPNQALTFPTDCYVVGQASTTLTSIDDINARLGSGLASTGDFASTTDDATVTAQFQVLTFDGLVYLIRAVSNVAALSAVGSGTSTSALLIDTFVPATTGNLRLAQAARHKRSGMRFFGASYTPTTMVDTPDSLDFTSITGETFYAPTIVVPVPELDASKPFVADLSNFLGEQFWTFIYSEVVASAGQTVNGMNYPNGLNVDADGKPILSLQKLQFVYDSIATLFTPNDLAHKYPLLPKQQILALTNSQLMEGLCWRTDNVQPDRLPPVNVAAQRTLPDGDGMDRANVVYSRRNRPVSTPTADGYLGLSVNSIVSLAGSVYRIEESAMVNDQTGSGFVSAVSSNANMVISVLFDYDNNELGTLQPYDPALSNKGMVFLNGYLGASGYTFSSADHFDVNDVLPSQLPLLEQITELMGGNWDVAFYNTDVSLPREFWSLTYDTSTAPGLPNYITDVPPAPVDPSFANRTRSLLLNLQNPVRADGLSVMDTYSSVVSTNVHLANGVTGSVFLSKKADRDVASLGTNPANLQALFGLPTKYDFFVFSRDHYWTLKGASFELVDQGYAMCLVDDGSGTGTKVAKYFIDSDGNYNELYTYALFSPRGGVIESGSFTAKVTLGSPANPAATPPLPETPNNVNPQDIAAQLNRVSNLVYAAFGPSSPGQPPAYLPIQAVGGGVQAAPITGAPGFNGYLLNVMSANRQPVQITQLFSGTAGYPIAGSTTTAPLNPRTGKPSPFLGSLSHGLDKQVSVTTLHSDDGTVVIPRPSVPAGPAAGVFGGNGLGGIIGTLFSVAFQGSGAIPPAIAGNATPGTTMKADDTVFYTYNAATNAVMDSTGKSATPGGGLYFVDDTDADNPIYGVLSWPKFTLNSNTYAVNLATTAPDGVTARYSLVVGGRSYLFDADNTHVTVDNTVFTFNPIRGGTYSVTVAAADAPAGAEAPSPIALTPFTTTAGGLTATVDVFNNPGGLADIILGVVGRTYTYDPVHGTVTVTSGATSTALPVRTGLTFASNSGYGYLLALVDGGYAVNGAATCRYSASTTGTPATYRLLTDPQLFTRGGNFYVFDQNSSGQYLSVTGAGQVYPINPYQFSINGVVYIVNTNVTPYTVVGGGNVYPMTANNTQFVLNGVQYTVALRQNSLNGATVSGQFDITQGNAVVIENYVYELDTLNGQIVGNGTAYPLTTSGLTYTISTDEESFTVTTHPDAATVTIGGVDYLIGNTTVVADGVTYPVLPYRTFTDGAASFVVQPDGTVAVPEKFTLTGNAPYTRATFTDGGQTYRVNDTSAFDGTNYFRLSGTPASFTAAGHSYTLRTDGVAISAGLSKTYVIDAAAAPNPTQFTFGTETIYFGRSGDVAAFDGEHYFAIAHASFTDTVRDLTFTITGNTAVTEGNSYEIFSNLGAGAYFEVPDVATYFINVAVADMGSASGDIFSVFPVSGGQFTIPLKYTVAVAGGAVTVSAPTFPGGSAAAPDLTAAAGSLTGGFFTDPVTKITYRCVVDGAVVTFVDSANAVFGFDGTSFVASVVVATGVTLALDDAAGVFPVLNNQFVAGGTTYTTNALIAYTNAAGPHFAMTNGRFLVPAVAPASNLVYSVRGNTVTKGYALSADDQFSATGEVVYTINAVNVVRTTEDVPLAGNEPSQTLTNGAVTYTLDSTAHLASAEPAGLAYDSAAHTFAVSYAGVSVGYTLGADSVTDNRFPANTFPATVAGNQVTFTDTVTDAAFSFDRSGNNAITVSFTYANRFFTDLLTGTTYFVDVPDARATAIGYLPETTSYAFVAADGKTYLIDYSDVSVVFPVVSGRDVNVGVATVGGDEFDVHAAGVLPAGGDPDIPVNKNSFEINGNLYSIVGTPNGADYSQCHVVGHGMTPEQFSSPRTFVLTDQAIVYTLQLDADNLPESVVATFPVRASRDLINVNDNVYLITYTGTTTGSLLGQGQSAVPIVNSAFTLSNPFDSTRTKFIFADPNIYDAASVVGQFTVYVAPTFFLDGATYTLNPANRVVTDSDKRPYPLIDNPAMFSINDVNYVIDTNQVPHAIVGNDNVSPIATDVTVEAGQVVPHSTFTLGGQVYEYVEDGAGNLLAVTGTRTYLIGQPGLTFKLDSSLVFTINRVAPAAGNFAGTTVPIGTITAGPTTLNLYAGVPESGGADFFTYKNMLYTLIASAGTYVAVQKTYPVYSANPVIGQQQLAVFNLTGTTCLVTDGTTAGAAVGLGINPSTLWAATAITPNETQFGLVYGLGAAPITVTQSAGGIFQFQAGDPSGTATLYDVLYTAGATDNAVKVDVPALLPNFTQSAGFTFTDSYPLTFETGGYHAFTTFVDETATPVESFSAAYKTPLLSSDPKVDQLVSDHGDLSLEFWHSIPAGYVGAYHPVTYAASTPAPLVYYVDVDFEDDSDIYLAVNNTVMKASVTPPVFSSQWRHVAMTYEQPYTMTCAGDGFEVKKAGNYNFAKEFSVGLTFAASDVDTLQGLVYKGTGSASTPPQLAMSYRVAIENGAVTLTLTDGEFATSPVFRGAAVLQPGTFYQVLVVKRTATPLGNTESTDPYAPPFDPSDVGPAATGGSNASVTAVPTDSAGTITVSDIQPAGAGANTDAAKFLQNISGGRQQAYQVDISVRTVNDDGSYGAWDTQSTTHPVTGGNPGMLVNSTGSAHLLIGAAYDDNGQAMPLGGSGSTGNIRDLYLFNSAIDPTGVSTSSGVVAIADASSNDLVKSGIVGYWAAKYDADGVVNNPLDDTAVAVSTNASRASLAPLSGREFEGTRLYLNGTAMTLARVTGSAIPSSMAGFSPGNSQLAFNAGTYKLEEISMWRAVRQPFQVVDDMFGRLVPSNEPDLIVYLSGSFDVQGIAAPILPLNKYIDHIAVKNAVASMDLVFSPASLDLAGCPALGRCGPLVTPNLYTPPGVALTLCDTGPALTTYSVTLNSVTGALAGVLNEAYVYIKDHVLTLYAGKKVGDLVLSWVSQEQGDVQLVGYVEGAPPAPMANLTNKSSYAGATSLTFTAPTSVTLKYSDSTELSDDTKWDFSLGEGAKIDMHAVIAPLGVGLNAKVTELDLALTEKISLDSQSTDGWQSTSTEKLDESNKYTVKLQGTMAPLTNDAFMANLNTQSTASNTVGTPASKTPILPNPSLGGFTASNPPAALPKPPTEERFGSRMFLPSPYGQAFVSSQTLDVYQQTLLQSNTVYGYVRVPNAQIPRDLNIVSFRMSSKYLRPGCLDGVIGYEYNPATLPTGAQTYATSTGQMELAYDRNFSAGSVGHDASYMRIVEAYALKRQIDQQSYNALAKYQTAYNGSAHANDKALTPGLDFYNEYIWSARGGTQEVKHTYTTSYDEQMSTSKVDTTVGSIAFNIKLVVSFLTIADFTATWTDTIKSTVKYQFNSTAQASFDVSANFDGIENDTQMRYASANDAHFVMNNNSMYNPNNQSGLDLVIGSDGLVYNIVPSVSSGAGLPVSDNIDTTMDYTQPQPSYTSGNATGLTGALQPYDRPGKTNLFRTLVFFLQPTKQNANDFWDTVVDPVWLVSSPEPDAAAMRSAVANASLPWRLLYRVTFSERFLAPTTAGSLAVPQITPVMAVPVLDRASDFLFQAIDAARPRPLHNPANDIEANIVLAAPTTSGGSAGTIQAAGPNTGLPLPPNNVIPFDLVKGASTLVNWGDTANTKLITQLLTSALGLNVLPMSTTALPGSAKISDVLDPVHGNVLYTSYVDPNGVTVTVPTDFGITVYQDVNGNPIQYFDGHSFWSLQADYVASPDGSVMYYIEPPASYDQSAFDLTGDYDLFGKPGDQWRYYLVSGFSSDLTSEAAVTGTGPFMTSTGGGAYTGFTIATAQHATSGAKQVAGYVLVKGIMQWPHLNSNAETVADVCVYKAMSLLDAFPIGDPEVLVSFLSAQYPHAPFADDADISLVFARNIMSYFNAAQQTLLPQ